MLSRVCASIATKVSFEQLISATAPTSCFGASRDGHAHGSLARVFPVRFASVAAPFPRLRHRFHSTTQRLTTPYLVYTSCPSAALWVLLCNGLVLLKTYLLTVIMLAHRPRVSMSPYLFHPLAIVAVVTSKPLATTHAELNNNCKLKLQIHPTRLFYKTHCLDDQQSHQALTLNSFPANLRDCLRQLSIMRNQQ